ncbi:MAG: septum formation initiator family protein [Nitrospinota bacterium]
MAREARKKVLEKRKSKGARKSFSGRRWILGRAGDRRISRFSGWEDFLPRGGLSAPRTVFAVGLALSLILFGVAMLRPGGILDVLRLTEQVGAMREEMEAFEVENGSLREEIRRLRSDPREVERIARDVLGLVRAGETVYEFIERE